MCVFRGKMVLWVSIRHDTAELQGGKCGLSMDAPTKSPFRKKMLLTCKHRNQNVGLLQIALAKYEKLCVFSPILSHLCYIITVMITFLKRSVFQ